MDSFEAHYNDILFYCKTVIKNKRLNLSPEDLLGDAYIKFIQSGESYDFNIIRKIIIKIMFSEMELNYRTEDINKYKRKQPRIIEQKCCKKCHEVKPAAAFRFQDYNGIKILRGVCIDCVKEGAREVYRLKHPIKERIITGHTNKAEYAKLWYKANKDRWNKYMKEWSIKRYGISLTREEYIAKVKAEAKPIQELWRKANKKYQLRQKQNLTDVYIRGILKASKKDFSPKCIEAKRLELLGKRNGSLTLWG